MRLKMHTMRSQLLLHLHYIAYKLRDGMNPFESDSLHRRHLQLSREVRLETHSRQLSAASLEHRYSGNSKHKLYLAVILYAISPALLSPGSRLSP
jgi:hypothetical protein